MNIWVCLKIGKTPKPNGFADHYPYEKWLAIIGNINPTFSDIPIYSTSTYEMGRSGETFWALYQDLLFWWGHGCKFSYAQFILISHSISLLESSDSESNTVVYRVVKHCWSWHGPHRQNMSWDSSVLPVHELAIFCTGFLTDHAEKTALAVGRNLLASCGSRWFNVLASSLNSGHYKRHTFMLWPCWTTRHYR